MGSWGASDAAEHKPRFLTDVEKRSCAATTAGWTVPAGGNGNAAADREVLVTIGGLATGLAAAEIKSMNWGITSFSVAAGGNYSVSVNYNETVVVTGSPQLTVLNDTSARNLTLVYTSGSGSNRLVYSYTHIAGDTLEDDVLSIGANAIALSGGTIAGADGGTAPEANLVGIGTAAGTITVVA